MKMFQFLKLCSVSQQVFSSTFKIFPILKRDTKLLLLRFSTSIKYHNIKQDKRTEPKNLDKTIIYKNDNIQYFKKIRLFSLVNYVIWTLFGINIYDFFSNTPEVLNDSQKQQWNDNVQKHDLTKKLIIASIALGFFLILAIWFFFLRSIKQIKLIKKTKFVEFQTYSFFPIVREFSVPLKDVSGVISRHAAKGFVPIKLRNSLFYYLIDVKGEFPDPFLFDNSVGVKRDFKDGEDE